MVKARKFLIGLGVLFVISGLINQNFVPIVIGIIILIVSLRNELLNIFNNITNINLQNFKIKNNMPVSIPSINPKKSKKVVLWTFIIIISVILLMKSVTIVPAGVTGVVHVFGKIKDRELISGIHLINPLAQVTKMSVRTEQYTMSIATEEGQVYGDDSIDALTKEGLKLAMDITILFHLDEIRAAEVFKEIGLNYEQKIIRPQIRGIIREVVAQYDAKEIYSDKREEAKNLIASKLVASLAPRGIISEDILLRNVKLPESVSQSIEAKLQAEQEAQRYDFVLEKETKEAERKRIEAAGQRDAQKIINESLTVRYLEYLYLQGLGQHQNAIYVPVNPNNGLPLFKNVE